MQGERRMIIKSKKIYTSQGIVDGYILTEGKIIKDIITRDDNYKLNEENVIDAEDLSVIPGLIDIHIHGAGGWSINGGSSDDIHGMCRYLSSRGTTAFQPTTGGCSLSELEKSLETIKKAESVEYMGAKMMGIHMEGPFISPEKKGIFFPEDLQKPSAELMNKFIELSGNNIRHVTLAPELEGAEKLISMLCKNNILVSGGHTNATIEETIKGINEGIRLSTHTCNAQRSIHHRQPGALGGYLLDDRVVCELICDLHHVHPEMIKLIVKIKTINKICMISDAVMAAGLEPGSYELLNQKVFIDKDGFSKLPDGTIAGSTKDLIYGVKKMVQDEGFSMEDVLIMASLNPAGLCGCEKNKGSIEIEKDADLVIIDNDFNVCYTFIEGKLVYDSNENENYKNPKVKGC